MKYYLPDGRTMVLADHSPDEWATRMMERLIALGCSQAYARRIARNIRAATIDATKEDA